MKLLTFRGWLNDNVNAKIDDKCGMAQLCRDLEIEFEKLGYNVQSRYWLAVHVNGNQKTYEYVPQKLTTFDPQAVELTPNSIQYRVSELIHINLVIVKHLDRDCPRHVAVEMLVNSINHTLGIRVEVRDFKHLFEKILPRNPIRSRSPSPHRRSPPRARRRSRSRSRSRSREHVIESKDIESGEIVENVTIEDKINQTIENLKDINNALENRYFELNKHMDMVEHSSVDQLTRIGGQLMILKARLKAEK